ncbi:probable methyltransferase At1g29790 [Mercurialis annua]|uniref:probable methyltransferase At1g29790 n=1 Tax=Mercurialis annua TaxID=3986 RepID=UPI00215F5991|nr:probable methyltransferase At1g29790 [Mercurialis annua]
MELKKHAHQNKYKFKILVLVILTNLLTAYIFAGPSLNLKLPSSPYANHHQLAATHLLIADFLQKLNSTNFLVQALLIELTSTLQQNEKLTQLPAKFNGIDNLSNEVMLAIGPHKLPLGYSPRAGSDEVYPPAGAACMRYQEDLVKYMTYQVGGECPVDDAFAQRLILKGCEPLPRRRCRPRSPPNYVEPTPLPDSLWAIPADTSIIWDPYTCKSYECLVNRKNAPGYFDCKDCFDLLGREKTRWMFDNGGIDYGIDQVLKYKPPGTIRIGLDIGGGSGTFAARMKERNVTIITSSMNLDGPFNSFIASRGLISIHVSVSQRLPFFENTLDIVHSMHILSNWIPDAMLEFTLYDIHRVLRPGGLFWLDHFFCTGSQLNETYIPMLDRVGFKKLRWNAGKKLDRGMHKNEWYFSALLEKPMT